MGGSCQQLPLLILVLQFTQLIARQVREMDVYCEIFPSNISFETISKFNGFIFSGGPQSVHDGCPEASGVAHEIIKLNEATNVPILGICYGQQLICHYFGAKVKKSSNRSFAKLRSRY